MDTGRLKYMAHDKYQDKVLIGNWFERKCSFVKTPHDFKTIYNVDFCPKPNSANDPRLRWDQIHKYLGYGARVLFDHQAPHFLENKSTLYDLSYNHLPKTSDGPIPRELRFRFQRYEPEPDYTRNFGNITTYGILDHYKEQWRYENQDPRRTLKTCYQETYVAPKHEKFTSWGIPLANSSAMSNNNKILYNLKLRGKQILAAPENRLFPFPHKPRCNPITWECPNVMKSPSPCILSSKNKK